VVGVYHERSIQLLISVLAIFKVGGVYLPLEPGIPALRLETMLLEAKARLLISNSSLYEVLLKSSTRNSELDEILQSRIIYLDKPINSVVVSSAVETTDEQTKFPQGIANL
jgi:non-ribosomal peptide synthetase component F